MDRSALATRLPLPAPSTRRLAWEARSTACTGIDCGGPKPFFMNSVLMVGAGGADLHAAGAINGYVSASGASAAAK